MQIYGKEYDYYDSALAYGQDPICKWVRKFKEDNTVFNIRGRVSDTLLRSILGQDTNLVVFSLRSSDQLKGEMWFHQGYVFFCGKAYPFVQYEHFTEKETFYTYDSLVKFMQKHVEESVIADFMKKRRGLFGGGTNETKLIEFFSKEIKCDALHEEDGIPVYILTNKKLHVGGRLQDFDFIKVFDPYTCLQELEMYVSGILGGQSPKMVEISDTDRLVGKGFDKITSFRNMKRR